MNAAVREIAPVEVYGAKDVRQFEIDDNPSIYHLMSEIVYTKLPLAIVREYLTNGWDSHKEAGTTHLFLEVHFSENPARILIKDRGTGLDFDGMNRVFRYYFRTTKDDNPEATGRLGIGSKVAFTCTTMFTAIGVKDGRRHVFAIHLGEKRRPHVATMTPVPDGLPTDEPNGVTIDIPLTDNSDIKVFQTYVQDLQRASAMKIRMFVSGKEIPAPDALFGPALAEHGFAYCTQPLVGDWGKAMPCVIQGEIPYSAEPISPSNHPISLRGLYLHAPSRAYEHNLSREALRVTDRARDTLRAQLAPIEAQIEGAYLALLTQTIERAPLSLFLCLADPDFRRDYFDKIAAGRKVFAGAAEAALYLAANGLDGALYAKVEQRFAERRFGRRFKSRADAQATIRRALAKAVGAVAATLGGDAAKTPLLRYMRAPKAPPPISPRSKAYMLLDPAPKRTDRQTYTRSDPAADPQADRTLALRQNRLAAAEAMLRAATAGAPALVIRPASVKTLHASWGDHPSPFTFYVLPTDPKSPAPPESHVPPGLAHQLRRLAGRAGIVVDTMPQLAEPRERPAAAPRLPAETPSAPKTVQPRLMRSVDFDHGSRGRDRFRIYASGALPDDPEPLFYFDLTRGKMTEGYYRLPRERGPFAFLTVLARLAPRRVAIAATSAQLNACQARGLRQLYVPGREKSRPLDDDVALRLLGWITGLYQVENTYFSDRSTWMKALKAIYLADFEDLWGKSLATAIIEHADQIAAASYTLGTRPAVLAAEDAWSTYAARRPLLALGRYPSERESLAALRLLAPDFDAATLARLIKG
ncbi:MAG TPA: ATP-binding protein [Beijerinckiaceae bacterium]|nr:ATP-binding protein [Rhodoblastus sp.]MCC2107931.1 ATP-binding protein [Hyphomicrobiales bacterium]HRY01596.1 ATP-binding protein [Beijerinckiaceae bacterium]